jgi:hypothetical protein
MRSIRCRRDGRVIRHGGGLCYSKRPRLIGLGVLPNSAEEAPRFVVLAIAVVTPFCILGLPAR